MHAAGGRTVRGRCPLLNWLDQLSQPAGDIIENALAEGARLLESGVHQLFHPEHAAALASQAGSMVGEFAKVLALPDDPATPLRGQLSGIKRVAWSDPLDLGEVKSVGKALDCTVNDVLMATVAGAFGAHLREAHGFDTRDLVVRASVPVNLRAAEEPLTLGNKFGLVFVDLPVGTRNPLQRVYTMHDTMRALKGSLQPPMTLMVLGMMGMLPAVVQSPAIELFSRKGTVVASNVPGPQAPLYLCGQRIAEMYFWVPQSGSMGIGVSILSYAGKVFIGMIADHALIPDPRPGRGPVRSRIRAPVAGDDGRCARPSRARGRRREEATQATTVVTPAAPQAYGTRDEAPCGKYLGLGLTHCSKRRPSRRISAWNREPSPQQEDFPWRPVTRAVNARRTPRASNRVPPRARTRSAQASAPAGQAQLLQGVQQVWLAGMGAMARAQKEGPGAFQDAVLDGLRLLSQSRSAAQRMVRDAFESAQETLQTRVGGAQGPGAGNPRTISRRCSRTACSVRCTSSACRRRRRSGS